VGQGPDQVLGLEKVVPDDPFDPGKIVFFLH